MNQGSMNLDDLITQEKKLAANEYQAEAWADGISEGIEPEILAEAAFSNALTELIREVGEGPALSMLDTMREHIIAGDFLAHRSLQ